MIYNTYTPPIANNAIRPTLLLPAIRSMPKKGRGSKRTTMSRNILVEAWVAHIAKNLCGSFVPHPMQVPSSMGFQFFAMGRHGKRASMKKTKPHTALVIINAKVHLRARRYCAVVVDVAVSAKRRKYWNRMASLMKVVLAQYAELLDQTCYRLSAAAYSALLLSH